MIITHLLEPNCPKVTASKHFLTIFDMVLAERTCNLEREKWQVYSRCRVSGDAQLRKKSAGLKDDVTVKRGKFILDPLTSHQCTKIGFVPRVNHTNLTNSSLP